MFIQRKVNNIDQVDGLQKSRKIKLECFNSKDDDIKYIHNYFCIIFQK